jgi:hypothetical protein
MSFSQADDILIKEQSTNPLLLPDSGAVGFAVDDTDDENDETSGQVDPSNQTINYQPTRTIPRVLDRNRRKQLLQTENKIIVNNNDKGKNIDGSSSTTKLMKATTNAFASLEEMLRGSTDSTSSCKTTAKVTNTIQEPQNKTLHAISTTKTNPYVDNDENCDPNQSCQQTPIRSPSKKLKNPRSHCPDQKPVRVVQQNSKSIVGSRPQHWEMMSRRSNGKQQRRSSWSSTTTTTTPTTPFVQPNQAKRKAALAAQLFRAKQQRRLNHLHQHHPRQSIQKDHSFAMRSAETIMDATAANATATNISFVPSFLGKSNRTTPADPVTVSLELMDDTNSTLSSASTTIIHEQSSRQNQTPPLQGFVWNSPPIQSTTTRKTVGGGVAGGNNTWSKRLKAIRDQIHGDRIRFQSGQYPFTVRPLHCNDPRYRAQSVADVTIAGIPIHDHQYQQHANTDPVQQQHHVLVPGYVHHWTQRSRNKNNNYPHNQHNDDDSSTRWFQGHCYAWIALPYETAKEQSVVAGVSLRIYNAIPVRYSGSKKASSYHDDDAWMLLCTQLCEPYPSSVLPALEVPPPVPNPSV